MTFSDVLEQIAFADLKRYLKSHENPKLFSWWTFPPEGLQSTWGENWVETLDINACYMCCRDTNELKFE